MTTPTPFNPLDIRNLGESVQRAILATDPQPLATLPSFRGVGCYAIYYVGDFPAYELVAEANRDGQWGQPIYVGKAEPEGGRTGRVVDGGATSTRLRGRLRQHEASVRAATNLNIDDFWARWLVVEPIWVPLGESLLISRFGPVWNNIVGGFGSNAAGSGREAGARSRWDTLHPGREHANRLAPALTTAEQVEQEVREHLRQRLQV